MAENKETKFDTNCGNLVFTNDLDVTCEIETGQFISVSTLKDKINKSLNEKRFFNSDAPPSLTMSDGYINALNDVIKYLEDYR
jgi:hypothetical protein